jgi:hypothetical protein
VTLASDAGGQAPAGFESAFDGLEPAEFPDNGAQSYAAPPMSDEKSLMSDSSCDNDKTYIEGQPCVGALQLFTENPDGTLSTTAAFGGGSNSDSGSSDSSSTSTTTLIIIGAAVGGVIVLIAIIAAVMYMKNKSGATDARKNTNTAQMTTANAV